MKVIGVGSAGCRIADSFAEYPQYTIYKIDNDLPKQKGNYCVERCSSVEEYEEKAPSFKSFFRGIKTGDEVVFVVCGASAISALSLRALEAIQRARVKILYIAPDRSLISNKLHTHERVVFGVLQEYARSGKINELLLLDNKTLLEYVGHGTIYEYFKKLNNYVYTVVHTLNFCNNVKPEFGSVHERKEISNICTVGYGLLENNEEKLFFLLDNITETSYIININEDELVNDVSVLPNVKAMVKQNKDLNRETSFAIWSTEESESYYYTKHYTHFIQEK